MIERFVRDEECCRVFFLFLVRGRKEGEFVHSRRHVTDEYEKWHCGRQGLSSAKQGDRRKEVYRSVGSISHRQSKSAKEKKAHACQDNA
jgi:hypothetical protein